MPLLRINASCLGAEKDLKSFTISEEELTFDHLLITVCNKLRRRTKTTRLYLKDGRELQENRINELSDGDSIVATDIKGWLNHPRNSVEIHKGLLDSRNVEIVIIGESSIIEEDAKSQLQSTTKLDGVRFAVGMPDLHPGHGFPIGAVVGTVDFIHPCLVGGDIGCGMSFVELDFKVASITDKKMERWSGLLEIAANDQNLYLPENPQQRLEEELVWGQNLIRPVSEDRIPIFVEGRRHQLNLRQYDRSLGTIGGGNHFCELQKNCRSSQ